MRTDTLFPIGWVPLILALLLVGCIAAGLFISAWWISEIVSAPEDVTTPLERERRELRPDTVPKTMSSSPLSFSCDTPAAPVPRLA